MMRCSVCGHENPPGYKFCTQCGSSLRALPAGALKYCIKCGAGLLPKAKFCHRCGKAVPKERAYSSAIAEIYYEDILKPAAEELKKSPRIRRRAEALKPFEG